MSVKRRRTYAIGDVHGCLWELEQLVAKLDLDDESRLVFVGDYVDRGSHSAAVIDYLFELRQQFEVFTLMGNHEEMFLAFLDDPRSVDAGKFIFNGGSSTLASYADDAGEYGIPQHHIDFLRSLPVWLVEESRLYVHAGLPMVPVEEIDPVEHKKTLLWTRGPFLRTEYDWGRMVIHGHTPVPRVDRRPNRIDLDTGCVFNGMLSAMNVDTEEVIAVHRRPSEHKVLRDKHSRRAAIRFTGAIPVYFFLGSEVIAMETVNYSELGMYVRHAEQPDKDVFEVLQPVTGIVGKGNATVRFDGTIVRRDRRDDGVYYGIQIVRRR